MFNSTARLGTEAITEDEYGNQIQSYTWKDVYVKPQSIRMSEFYEAATAELKPDIALTLADSYDYEGERVVEYEGVIYDVIRTYIMAHTIELTLARRTGRG